MNRLFVLSSALAVIILFFMVFFYAWRPIANYDIFWHMATGRLILEQKELPRVNTFNYPNPAEPYQNECWLFDLASHVFWLLTGSLGICGYATIAILLTFIFLFLTLLKRGVPAVVSVLLVMLTLFLIEFRFLQRNFLLSYLFLSIYLYFFPTSDERSQKRALTLYPLVMIFWANIHIGCYVGVWLIGLGLLTSLLKKSSDFPKPKFWLALFIVVFLSSGVSPYPFLWIKRLFQNFWVYAPIRSSEQVPANPREFGLFYLSLLAVAIIIIFNLKRLHPFYSFGIAVFGIAASWFLRFIGEYGIFLAIFFGEAFLLSSGLREKFSSALRSGLAVLLSLIAITIGVAKSLSDFDSRSFGCRIDCELLPCRAIDFMENNLSPAPIYNNLGFGGYIEWRLFPKWKTFWDGRWEPQVKKAERIGKEGLSSLLEEYGAGYAIVSRRQPLLWFEKIFLSERWVPIYFDRAAIVLADRHMYPDVAERLGYFAINPLYRELPIKAEYLDLARSELERAKKYVGAQDVFLNEIEVRILIRQGRLEEAEQVFVESLKSWRKVGSLLALGGELYIKLERFDDALKILKKARKNEADTASVLNNLGVVYWRIGKFNKAIYSFKRAVARDKNFAPAVYNLYLLYDSLGESKKSKVWLERYREITARAEPAKAP